MADVSEPCVSSIFKGCILHIQPLKMKLSQGSETSANYNLTPGKYPKEHIQYLKLFLSRHFFLIFISIAVELNYLMLSKSYRSLVLYIFYHKVAVKNFTTPPELFIFICTVYLCDKKDRYMTNQRRYMFDVSCSSNMSHKFLTYLFDAADSNRISASQEIPLIL